MLYKGIQQRSWISMCYCSYNGCTKLLYRMFSRCSWRSHFRNWFRWSNGRSLYLLSPAAKTAISTCTVDWIRWMMVSIWKYDHCWIGKNLADDLDEKTSIGDFQVEHECSFVNWTEEGTLLVPSLSYTMKTILKLISTLVTPFNVQLEYRKI